MAQTVIVRSCDLYKRHCKIQKLKINFNIFVFVFYLFEEEKEYLS